MRIGHGLIAGSLILVWAVGSASQVPNQGTTVSPPSPVAVRDLRAQPTDGVLPLNPVTTVKDLSVEECESLGGTVYEDQFGLCASKLVCSRTDNFGKKYAVCLSAQK